MTLTIMCKAINKLTKDQIQCVRKIGLGTLFGIAIDNLPNTLNYYLLDHYDAESNCIILENHRLEITKSRIHDALGISMEGHVISELPSCGSDNQILEEWRAQFVKTNLSNTYIMKLITDSDKDDAIFKLNFLTIFINTFIESKPMGTSNDQYVDKLVLVEDYTKLDWCEYVIQSLKRRKAEWDRNDVTCYYAGPIVVMLFVYMLSVKLPQSLDITKQRPFIKCVKGHKLEKFERFEIDGGKLGKGDLDEKLDDIIDEIKEENEGDKEKLETDFADEEAYAAVIDFCINKILHEKHTLDQALESGTTKYPNSAILKECMAKLQMLFSMEGSRFDGGEENITESMKIIKSDENIKQCKEGILDESAWNCVDSPFTPMNIKKNEKGKKEEGESSRRFNVLDNDVQNLDDLTPTQFFNVPIIYNEVVELMDLAIADRIGNVVNEVVENSIEMGTRTKVNVGSLGMKGVNENVEFAKDGREREMKVKENVGTGGDVGKGRKGKGRRYKANKINKENVRDVAVGRLKRKVKFSTHLKSPYFQRVIMVNQIVKSEERNFCNSVLTSKRDDEDVIWETDNGETLRQMHAYHFQEDMMIHRSIIDCWGAYLNIMVDHKADESPKRVFFTTEYMSETMLDESVFELHRITTFNGMVDMFVESLEIKENLSDVGLVFFPIVDNTKYYLLSFDLKKGNYIIIDHVKRNGNVEERYGKVPWILVRIR